MVATQFFILTVSYSREYIWMSEYENIHPLRLMCLKIILFCVPIRIVEGKSGILFEIWVLWILEISVLDAVGGQ